MTKLLLFLTVCAPLFAQERISRVETGLRPGVRIEGQPEQRWTVAERMAQHETPGVSVTVIANGEVAWSRAWGVLAAGSQRKVNVDSLFQAASISKPVAALAVLRLVAQGKLDLDEDVNTRLKSWKASAHSFGKPVTLRQLLSHTAGTTVHGFPGYAAGKALPTLADLLSGKGNTAPVFVDTEPGTKWRYSGGGYEIAQQLVEDTAGKPFAAVAKQLVLEPLDLTRSTYEQPLPERLAANASWAHDRHGKAIGGRWHTYPEQAAAGLWTRPLDLARVLVAMQRAVVRGDTKLLPSKLSGEMLTDVLNSGYGLGWSLGGSDDKRWFAHGGSNAGFRCYAVAYPKLGMGAVVMTNSDNGNSLVNEILRSISAEYSWPDHKAAVKKVYALTPEQLSAFAGTYEFQGMKVVVKVSGQGLRLETLSGPSEFLPESESAFFPMSDGAPPVTFDRDASGRVNAIRAGRLAGKRID